MKKPQPKFKKGDKVQYTWGDGRVYTITSASFDRYDPIGRPIWRYKYRGGGWSHPVEHILRAVRPKRQSKRAGGGK